jgi:hypothetical protein
VLILELVVGFTQEDYQIVGSCHVTNVRYMAHAGRGGEVFAPKTAVRAFYESLDSLHGLIFWGSVTFVQWVQTANLQDRCNWRQAG